jgi:hypothetical protein
MGILIAILYSLGFVFFFFKYLQLAFLFYDLANHLKVKLLTSKFVKTLILIVPFITAFFMALFWPIAELIRFVNGLRSRK